MILKRGEDPIMTATITKLTGIVIAGLTLFTTACATAFEPKIPAGTYHHTYPTPERVITVKDGKIVAHDDGPDAIDDLKIVDWAATAGAIEVIDYGIDGGKVMHYCATDTLPDHAKKLPTDRKALAEMTMTYKCDFRHGFVWVPIEY